MPNDLPNFTASTDDQSTELRRTLQRTILANAAQRCTGFVLPLPAIAGEHLALSAEIIEEMIKRQFVVERPVFAHEAYWIDEGNLRKTMLVITGLGQRTLAADPQLQALTRDGHGLIVPQTLPVESEVDAGSMPPVQGPLAIGLPRGKLGLLVTALASPDGATIAELCSLTGWKSRSVRAAISSSLKQRGIEVESTGHRADRHYRVSKT